jgi:subtilase family serine protease/ribosomal protein L40E
MRNDGSERMARTILAVFVAWTLLFSGIVGMGASFVALAGDDPIEPRADWNNCNTTVTVSGDIKLDGNLSLQAGCVLTVLDGGISFVQDDLHRYSLNINLGATLNLTNSYVTVETDQIDPYLLLPVTVTGTLIGWNAILQFPGFINVTGTFELWDSEVMALSEPSWATTIDRFNDAPVFTFTNGEGRFYRSTIDDYFINSNIPRTNATLGWMYDFRVTGADVWLVDTYLDVDYSSSLLGHNVLQVGDNANVYAYNMTIDTSVLPPNRIGAIQTTGSGIAYILRWANVLCVDNEGVPIETVSLDPLLVQTGARPDFPDSGTQTPHAYILTYLGRTALTWLVTGPNGKSMVPLLSEYIDDTVLQTTPNSEYYGAYEVTGTYNQPPVFVSAAIFSFNPYPAMDPVDGTADVTLIFDTFLPKPDLIVIDVRWTPANPDENSYITFEADIQNNGLTGANDVLVCFYVDGQPLNNTPTLISFVAGGGGVETTPIVPPDLEVFWYGVLGGNHTVLVVADCGGDISESDETNNGYTETIYVIPLIPDYLIQPGFIGFPAAAYIGNPVQMNITISNPGKDLAPENTVKIYIGDPSLGGAVQIGEVPISNISAGSTTQAFFQYTFDVAKDYKICVWVDADDLVFEESETNNMACNVLTVRLAPNLAVTTNDIGVGDPCTRMGQTVTPQAVVRNIGYVDAGAYVVDFYIDGDYFASGNSTGLLSNQTETVSADVSWVPAVPGIHVLSVDVDPTDTIKESTNADNIANKDILVFHNKMAATYAGTGTLPVDNTFHGNVDITGSLTIDGKSVYLQQADPLTGRYCIKVYGTGELILKNGANLTSNYPLVIYVSDSASLVADDATIDLDVLGTGGLFADQSAVVDLRSSVLNGNLFSTGNSVTLMGVDLLGTDLYIEAAEASYIWDSPFTGVQNLFLLSDDGDVNTIDFDIRNITFPDYLDAQLVFKGNQLVELTNVMTYIPEGDEWWTDMVTEMAKVRLYWWLTVKMVDGTGAVLASLTPEMNLDVLDEANLVWTPVFTGLNVPGGEITFRALSEEMQGFPIWGWTNSTYAIDARVQVSGVWFYPDSKEAQGNWTGDVRDNMEIELKFSGLTPDFSVSMISFIGDGIGINQPVNRYLVLQTTVYNSGNIAAVGVEVMWYLGSDMIGYDVIDLPAAGSEIAQDDEWIPNTIGAKVILSCVDDNSTIPETNELNNCGSAGLNVFGWPDLYVDTADILFDVEPFEQIPSDVTAGIRNVGTNTAVNVEVTFADDEGWSTMVVVPNIGVGEQEEVTVQWTPLTPGTHSFTVTVDASNTDIFQTDYDQTNNFANRTVLVLTLPDLQVEEVRGSDWVNQITVGISYDIFVMLNNTGGSTARNVTVVLTLDDDEVIGQATMSNITSGGTGMAVITCPPIPDIGNHVIRAIADPDDIIMEIFEDNNIGVFPFEVIPPSAYVTISVPEEGQDIDGGTTLIIEGWVKEVGTERGIEGVHLVMRLQTLDIPPAQLGVDQYIVSEANGRLLDSFVVPDEVVCDGGSYNFVVLSNETYVASSFTSVQAVACEEVFWTFEVILLLLIIIIVVVVIAAITAYIKVFGLGKLVECGECGAFIPEDSTACPKCGVQFETETAKCSSCQAWIPVKVKKCPECGVEFATGEVEMEDYKKKMRMQYDEVKAKFKKEAQQELGKSLTDAEFEDWWRTQPTFVSFAQWTKQEEDMRKMGSKPCPSCGTLNSVTATVCHKCGALMSEDEKPRRPPSRPPAEKKPVAAVPAKREAVTPTKPGEQQPPAAGAPPAAVQPVPKKTLPTVERPVPKKVVKKPVVEGAPTVVPKKVVRKPEEEEEEGGGY